MLDKTPVQDDDDLGKRSAKTNFNIQRIFKYFVLFLCIGVIALLAVVFTCAMIADSDFRKSVNAEIVDNIVGIIIAGLAIIGINLGMLRK